MNRGRNDGMRSQMDGYNKIQRHKGRREEWMGEIESGKIVE